MSDLPNELPSSLEEARPKEERTAPKRSSKKRKAPVYTYLIILFLAAFILLAMSYFMQQRKLEGMDESLAGLKESVASMPSVQDLLEENTALREQTADLEARLAEAEEALAASSDAVSQANETLLQTILAMDWFWQIDEAYVRGRYALCRELIANMESTEEGAPLKSYLPEVSTTDTDRYSPAQRYQEICDALGVETGDGSTFSTTLYGFSSQ